VCCLPPSALYRSLRLSDFHSSSTSLLVAIYFSSPCQQPERSKELSIKKNLGYNTSSIKPRLFHQGDMSIGLLNIEQRQCQSPDSDYWRWISGMDSAEGSLLLSPLSPARAKFLGLPALPEPLTPSLLPGAGFPVTLGSLTTHRPVSQDRRRNAPPIARFGLHVIRHRSTKGTQPGAAEHGFP
jgi:hypothetical protein